MAKTSTLGSPGIEVIEQDNSVRVSTSTATTAFVAGFASQGPVEEIATIGSIEDFEMMYGAPTNVAERYFYNSVKVLKENAGPGTTVYTSRLPYGSGQGDNISSSYTLHAYPAIPIARKDGEGYDKYLNRDNKLSSFFSVVNQKIQVSTGMIIQELPDSIGEVDLTNLNQPSEEFDMATNKYEIDLHHNFYFIGKNEIEDVGAVKAAKDELLQRKDQYKFSMVTEPINDVRYFVWIEETEDGEYVAHARKIIKTISSFTEMYESYMKWLDKAGKTLDDEIVIEPKTEKVVFIDGGDGLDIGCQSFGIYAVSDVDNMHVEGDVFVEESGEEGDTFQIGLQHYSFISIQASYSQLLKDYETVTPVENHKPEVKGGHSYIIKYGAEESRGALVLPKEVVSDVVITDGSIDPEASIYIHSICFNRPKNDEDPDDDSMLYRLPDYNEKIDAVIKWSLVDLSEQTDHTDDETEKTVVGKAALERLGNNTILHFTFPLSNEDGTNQIGIAHFTATYEDVPLPISFNQDILEIEGEVGDVRPDVVTNWELVKEEQGNIKFTYESAYEIQEFFTAENNASVTYLIGSPITYHISAEMFSDIATGEGLKWGNNPFSLISDSNSYNKYENIGNAAFLIINKSRTNCNEAHEGYYTALSDNTFVSPSDDYVYNAIDSVKTTTKVYDNNKEGARGITDEDYDKIVKSRLNFYLDSNYQGSISRIMERGVTSFDMSDNLYDDTLNIGVFKLNKSATNQDVLKLSYSLHETYNASFGISRQKSTKNSNRALSYFVETEVEGSSNIAVFVNPNLANSIKLDGDGNLLGKMRIFGPKLINNTKYFEQKYLADTYTKDKMENVNYETAISPIRLGNQCIKSYSDMINQSGVNNRLLAQIKALYPKFNEYSSLLQFGTYQESAANQRQIIGNVPAKLKRALNLIFNDEEYPNIDILVQGGLGTIYAYSNGPVIVGEQNSLVTESERGGQGLQDEDDILKQTNFVDTLVLKGIEDLRTGQSSLSDEAQAIVEDYTAVENTFLSMANAMVNGGRGDCFYVSDILRGILIKGKDTKITKLYGQRLNNSVYSSSDVVNHSWTTSVYYPIKHSTSNITTNYESCYAQWFKVLDDYTGEKYWVPSSPYVAALMCATDSADGPWTAAAGVNRGVVQGVLDHAISPTLSERTDLYNICINSIPKIPNAGLAVWGIRTMGRKDSAFDQNTCRRTFLYMEKIIKRYLRNYIFEKNTTYTRLQIVNDLEPVMENILNQGGIYNYRVVCDSTNNTAEIINNGDLAVEVSAAPTRTAENIILTMVANKYTDSISASSSI